MAAKTDARTICGATAAEIRKAFFTGKVGDFLARIQAEGEWGEKDVKLLGMEFERLKNDETELVKTIRSTYTGELPIDTDAKPPSVEELTAGAATDAEWRAKADAAIAYIDGKMDEVRHMVAKKEKIPPSFWLDTASIINSYQSVLDRDLIYKEQRYRALITQFIDKAQCSRAEAEERARLTPEYAAFKNMERQRERIGEFIMLAKKHDASNRPNGW